MWSDIELRGVKLADFAPALDGEIAAFTAVEVTEHRLAWRLVDGRLLTLSAQPQGDAITMVAAITGHGPAPLSIGFACTASGARDYLRNGYHSWDGSWFTAAGTPDNSEDEGKQPTLGFAMTALTPANGDGLVILGFERHDRFQTRFRFGGTAERMTIIAETLLDGTDYSSGEALLIFDDREPDNALRRWSKAVAAASPLPPRIPDRRLTGWCSWYNLYAAITEENIREHLAAAIAFRDAEQVPLDIFQIDDGFTPEMGDWLDVRPQFPAGMAPLLADIADAGFRPGLWIAPFMVGNRSALARDHPDWLVRDAETGEPLVQMRFYGEFRWHKRSEEYHILDITHPGAEAWMRCVFRTWAREWGARYFKADFLLFGSEHGPDRARWHRPGQSRIAIWRRMLATMREEVGNKAIILGCGCPLWASVGLVDAVRIGRDVGARWSGEQSAESLLRDHGTRSHANGILWQADPDCVLLRDRYHDLTDQQIEMLSQVAGSVGGVLMTSDNLGELSIARRQLFANLLRDKTTGQ
jgi:alpha-galactosidase